MVFPGCKNTLTFEETNSLQCWKVYIEIYRIYKKKLLINSILIFKKILLTIFIVFKIPQIYTMATDLWEYSCNIPKVVQIVGY